MPHVAESVAEAVRALDTLGADGVVLLANHAGTYIGGDGQDELFAALDERSAVVLRPPGRPRRASPVPGVVPWAVDFLLDTTRAAVSFWCATGIRARYPDITFILSHAGGFVPYASHRMAMAIFADTGATRRISSTSSPASYFDTGVVPRARRRCRPCLLSPSPEHITFGSDWPFAPVEAGQYFAAGLDSYLSGDPSTLDAVNTHERAGAVSEAHASGVNRTDSG